MQPYQRAAFAVACAVAALACSVASLGLPGARPTPTLTAVPADTADVSGATSGPPISLSPTETAAPAPRPGAGGIQISYQNLAFVIPDGLGTGTTNNTTTDVEFPYINPSNGDMPQHLRADLVGYPIQDSRFTPQIEVFRAQEYAQYTDYTRGIIETLKSMQYYDGQPLPAGLPDGELTAHVASVPVPSGTGIRYLAEFSDAPLPANNRDLIYYFHGLTASGDWYVQAILPVHAPFLAADSNLDAPLPPDGIAFNMDDITGYFRLVADKLNATPPGQFTPRLAELDAITRSISVK